MGWDSNPLSFFFFLIMYFFLAALGLRCCTQAFASCGERGLLFIAARGLPIAVAPHVKHGLLARGLQSLWHAGSVVVVHGFSCSTACGIFLDQGSNPCPCIGRQILNHCTTREVPPALLFIFFNSTCYFLTYYITFLFIIFIIDGLSPI